MRLVSVSSSSSLASRLIDCLINISPLIFFAPLLLLLYDFFFSFFRFIITFVFPLCSFILHFIHWVLPLFHYSSSFALLHYCCSFAVTPLLLFRRCNSITAALSLHCILVFTSPSSFHFLLQTLFLCFAVVLQLLV